MEKINFKILENWIQQPKNKVAVASFAFMALIITYVSFNGGTSESTNSNQEIDSADTYIPAGFVLVPIELQNAEALSSLISEFAVVDLFTGSLGSKHSRVGQRLKLLRAPRNPQQFAVLVPENQVQTLLATPGPYWAAIQNPNEKKGVNFHEPRKSRIEFVGGGT